MTVQTTLHEGNLQCPKFMPDTKDYVKHFVCQLEAGYAGNTRVALGASRGARAACKCAEKSKSLLMQAAAALVGLGNVHMRLSMLDHGECSKSLSQMKINHGSLGGAQLKYEEAREHYMKALEIYNDLAYKGGQRIVQCNLGNLYHRRRDLQQALEWYKKTIYFSGTLHRSTTALLLHLKFAEVFLEMESWEAAWDTLKIAEKIAQGTERVATASVQHLIRTYFFKMGLAKERMKQGGKTEIAGAKKSFFHSSATLYLPRGNPQMVRVSFEEVALEDGNLDREKLTALVTSTISELLPNPRRSQEAEKNLAFLYKLLIKPVENNTQLQGQLLFAVLEDQLGALQSSCSRFDRWRAEVPHTEVSDIMCRISQKFAAMLVVGAAEVDTASKRS
ncbi:unnamed protein product [Calypogeia fissa]